MTTIAIFLIICLLILMSFGVFRIFNAFEIILHVKGMTYKTLAIAEIAFWMLFMSAIISLAVFGRL